MPTPIRHRSAAFVVVACLIQPALAPAQSDAPLSVPQLLRNLESDNAAASSSSARTLGVVFAPGGRGGDDRARAVAALIGRLDSPRSADLRRQCAIALGEIRAAEAAEPMKKALADADVEVVLAAGEAVAKILPVDDARAYLTGVGEQGEGLARVGAYHGLATIAKPADAAFLLTGVSSDNWRAQQASVRGLQRAVAAGAELDVDQCKAIAKVLDADTVNAASAAVDFFVHTQTSSALAALRDAADPEVHPDDWRMRMMALRAIYHRGWPRSRPELDLVVRNLGDPTANVSNEVWRFLNDLQKEHRVSLQSQMPILVAELERAKPLSRRAAIMEQMPGEVDAQWASRAALVAVRTLDEASRSEAEEAWQAQAQSLRIIGATGHCGAMEAVARSVDSNVGNVRSAAGDTLQRLGPICPADQAAKVAPILEPHLTRSVDWRKAAVAAASIGAYANEATPGELIALLPHEVLNVRQGASRSLIVIASGEDAAMRSRVDGLLHERLAGTPASWEYGAPVLAALNDPKAVGLLTRMLKEGDWRSQEAAARAVQALAERHAIRDEALNGALVAVSQSDVVQVQRACDLALRELAKPR